MFEIKKLKQGLTHIVKTPDYKQIGNANIYYRNILRSSGVNAPEFF